HHPQDGPPCETRTPRGHARGLRYRLRRLAMWKLSWARLPRPRIRCRRATWQREEQPDSGWAVVAWPPRQTEGMLKIVHHNLGTANQLRGSGSPVVLKQVHAKDGHFD